MASEATGDMTDADSGLRIRPIAIDDAEAISHIQNYYISQTIKTIYYTPFSIDAVRERIRKALDEGYPALVAESVTQDRQDSSSTKTGTDGDETSSEYKIVGYVSTSRFRPQDGWSPSAEVSLFLGPGTRRKRIGTALIEALIARLREVRKQIETESRPAEHKDNYCQIINGLRDIRQLIAVCVVDEDDLEAWYRRFGFQRVASFEKGGYKFGSWIDIVMLQLTL